MRALRPRAVLELGTNLGVSAAHIALALDHEAGGNAQREAPMASVRMESPMARTRALSRALPAACSARRIRSGTFRLASTVLATTTATQTVTATRAEYEEPALPPGEVAHLPIRQFDGLDTFVVADSTTPRTADLVVWGTSDVMATLSPASANARTLSVTGRTGPGPVTPPTRGRASAVGSRAGSSPSAGRTRMSRSGKMAKSRGPM